ncbi:hypothetical protein CDL12_00337 [Handroanthus impetiginosus]|uniref:Uncharacterized protein n=1 Tax=Handroanthus impetiginosus TaxID=429701 RepID=A0A2G9IAW2_9LAMI|nr:hypothetical protein CDL12_00337 [Handroanthus impetiginosus]
MDAEPLSEESFCIPHPKTLADVLAMSCTCLLERESYKRNYGFYSSKKDPKQFLTAVWCYKSTSYC